MEIRVLVDGPIKMTHCLLTDEDGSLSYSSVSLGTQSHYALTIRETTHSIELGTLYRETFTPLTTEYKILRTEKVEYHTISPINGPIAGGTLISVWGSNLLKPLVFN